MTYTTHGLMSPADLADHRALYDLDCEPAEDYDDQIKAPDAPMGTDARLAVYFRQSPSRKLTPAQRRRVMKKAGPDPEYVVLRDEGMGYSPARQGMKQITYDMPVPVSGAGY